MSKTMHYFVLYPSGRKLRFTGQLKVLTEANGRNLPCVISGKRANVLDPRVLIRDEMGKVVFDGRDVQL